MALAAVDQGGGFQKTVVLAAGGARTIRDSRGATATPSVIFKQDDGTWLMGVAAQMMARVRPDRSVSDCKRRLGSSDIVGAGITAFDATVVMFADAKRRIEDQTHEAIDGAVLLKPATFTDEQTADLIRAAEAAGFPVLGVVSEPSAATLAVLDGRPMPSGIHRILTIDFGSTTFDVAVVEYNGANIKVLAADGVSPLGGADLTAMVGDLVCKSAGGMSRKGFDLAALPAHQRHQFACDLEEAKLHLGSQSSVPVPVPLDGVMQAVLIDRANYEAGARKLLQPGVECIARTLAAAGVSVGQLSLTVYTGSPMHSEFTRKFFDNSLGVVGTCAPDPSLAGVMGGLLHAQRIVAESGAAGAEYLPPSSTLTDCTTQSIGVEVIRYEGGKRVPRCRVLVQKGARIPFQDTIPFAPETPNQSMVSAVYLQGDANALSQDCTVLGKVDLPITPEAVVRKRLELLVAVKHNSMVELTLRDTVSGEQRTVTLDPTAANAPNSGWSTGWSSSGPSARGDW